MTQISLPSSPGTADGSTPRRNVRSTGTDRSPVALVPALGAYDPSFNGTGYATTDYGVVICCGVNGDDSDYSLVLQPDGKILAGGTTFDGQQRVNSSRVDSDS